MKRLAILSLGILAVPVIAIATPAPKVFVCKYVGQPGVNETLQTGQNPISVSSNAIKNYAGVGSSFNDAQGRSYVIAEDMGQTLPPTCPAGQGTPQAPPSTPPTTPPTPQVQGVTSEPQFMEPGK